MDESNVTPRRCLYLRCYPGVLQVAPETAVVKQVAKQLMPLHTRSTLSVGPLPLPDLSETLLFCLLNEAVSGAAPSDVFMGPRTARLRGSIHLLAQQQCSYPQSGWEGFPAIR